MRTKEKTMDKFTQIKNFICGQFEGVFDDQWVDVEEQTIVLLQDRFDLSLEEAEKEIAKFFK
jgi:hypothetical protein